MRPDKRIQRSKALAQKHSIGETNPDLLYLLWDELRSANFRLAILIGTNAVLVALLLTAILRD
jgi:hypothetical protein